MSLHGLHQGSFFGSLSILSLPLSALWCISPLYLSLLVSMYFCLQRSHGASKEKRVNYHWLCLERYVWGVEVQGNHGDMEHVTVTGLCACACDHLNRDLHTNKHVEEGWNNERCPLEPVKIASHGDLYLISPLRLKFTLRFGSGQWSSSMSLWRTKDWTVGYIDTCKHGDWSTGGVCHSFNPPLQRRGTKGRPHMELSTWSQQYEWRSDLWLVQWVKLINVSLVHERLNCWTHWYLETWWEEHRTGVPQFQSTTTVERDQEGWASYGALYLISAVWVKVRLVIGPGQWSTPVSLQCIVSCASVRVICQSL